jgi:hypothetical protein
VPIYNGEFRVVQQEVVLADVDAQIAAGARHITFGDPDFFNGPTHAMKIVAALHAKHPAVSYDVTIKVEHLLHHRELVPRLADTGCAFVTSAIESVDDRVLALFDKGHTREDFVDAVAVCRASGVTLVPTFVAFHPWLTRSSYCDCSTRSTFRSGDAWRRSSWRFACSCRTARGCWLDYTHVGPFDPETLAYRWSIRSEARAAARRRGDVGKRLTANRAWSSTRSARRRRACHRALGDARAGARPRDRPVSERTAR